MCGIAGFIDFNNKSNADILKACTDTLEHRGPDGSGYEFIQTNDCQVGLGHRRLSIIDLSNAASQPMWYKNLCIIFNGEIYNYAEIKLTLEKLGHSFSTHSDTEMILHAWEQWGAKMLEHFIGMFSFSIFDNEKNKLFCCRDRVGVKPFIYYWEDGLFIFGSELKALVKHPSFRKEINLDAAAAFMQYGYVPTPHCIFKDTYKLKPGHYLEFDINKCTISTEQYWNVYDRYNQPTLNISLPDAIEETEKILTNAFQYRMVSDVPVGVFLSGGYDSTCVTALLQKNNSEKIKTFTIGVPDGGLNEAPFAKEIAQHLGTDHTEYYCTQKEALEIIPELSFFYDEPFADSSAIPTSLVSKIARQKVTVALSADGGDEIFAGYNRYEYVTKYGKKLQALPPSLRKKIANVMDKIPANSIPVFNKKYLFHSRYEKIKSLLKNPSEKNILLSLTQQMDDENISRLFINKVATVSTAFDSTELKPEFYSTLSYLMAIDYQTYLPDDILQKVDRATMSVGLEGREPFLDHRIIDWAAQLPMEYKYNNGNKKFIIKEIVHKYISPKTMDRPKMGFGIPVAEWLSGPLKHFVDQYLEESFVQKQNIFNYQEIQTLRNSFYNGKKEKAEKIWFILMFQMWYDRWMNNTNI
ncbi:MAG: asparagine synthase (glutamine-hydrolyzing) [Ginsengibacter sp.]